MADVGWHQWTSHVRVQMHAFALPGRIARTHRENKYLVRSVTRKCLLEIAVSISIIQVSPISPMRYR